ncbi:MAG: 1-deoxy-D-xylulose-5-phosphate reductoisomerase [Phycisphaerae bacterium]
MQHHHKPPARSGQQTPRRVAVLGSTGSIGCNTVEVLEHLGSGYEITGLAAAQSWEKLSQQALRTHPKVVALSHPTQDSVAHLRCSLAHKPIAIEEGAAALDHMVQRDDVDVVVAAVVGAAGLSPVLRAAEAGKWIALANKEALVVAGCLVMPLAQKHGAHILPIDSEHSAIFQSLRSGQASEIRRIILTASGGPFRTWPAEKAARATVAEALNHPNWNMGPKITIDSATLMNKALEIIEAHWLFGLPADRIEVLIHPQSIIHSMIEFVDGSIIAQLGTPDMRTAIQYAITHPARVAGCSTRLDWSKIKEMTFEEPKGRFPALELGFEVIRRGGTTGAVVNAANEKANELFRAGKMTFGQIVATTQKVLDRHLTDGFIAQPTLTNLLAADRWARHAVLETIQ